MASYVKSTKEILNQYTELHELIEQKKYTEADIKIKKISEIKNALDIDYVFSDCAQLLQESISGIHRVKDIVQGLKTFSRVDDTDTQLTDLNDCIEAAVKVLWNEIKHKCVLNKDLNVLPLFYCHSGQMVQVFTNLLLNAVQAIDHSGKIEIKSSSNASSITISITDSGHGITPENLKQIFTPFFSTKPVGSGTGLGLSISYGIIKGCGGEILVSSTVGRGTTFTIKLPVKETV